MLILLAVMLPVGFLSELRRDAALMNTFRPDLSVTVERASCSRYFLLVSSCSVQLSWVDDSARRTANTSFLVGLKSMDGVRVLPVRSSADATVVTSAVALENLTNRTYTLLLIPGTCLLLSVVMLVKLHRGRI
jgi:hypothetical protein